MNTHLKFLEETILLFISIAPTSILFHITNYSHLKICEYNISFFFCIGLFIWPYVLFTEGYSSYAFVHSSIFLFYTSSNFMIIVMIFSIIVPKCWAVAKFNGCLIISSYELTIFSWDTPFNVGCFIIQTF